MLSPLSLRLLGKPLLRTPSSDIELSRNRPTLLMLYLVSRPEPWQWTSRAAVIDSLESTDAALRKWLTDAQKQPWFEALEAFGGSGLEKDTQGNLRWQLDSDLSAFNEAVQRKRWNEALGLYEGEFLQGFDRYVEDILPLEDIRRAAQRKFREATLGAVGELREREQHGTAADLLERFLTAEPFDEEVLREAMRAAAAAGQEDRATMLFERFARLLKKDLELEPDGETLALLAAIERGESLILRQALTPQAGKRKLPETTTSFVGRHQELDTLSYLLSLVNCRLLTLVGMGGVGKTRLAIEAAGEQLERFPDGVYFVPLAEVQDERQVVARLVEALELNLLPSVEAEKQLLDYLHNKTLLLVLDNVESAAFAAPLFDSMLRLAPQLKLLATSRERLAERSFAKLRQVEQLLAVGGLSLVDSESLLLERSAKTELAPQEKAAVSRLHTLLQGWPLGLELVAGLSETFDYAALVETLDDDLGALESSASRVGLVFETSFAHLDQDLQKLYAQVSVFRGPFSAEAAEHVAGADRTSLMSLSQKSLVQLETAGSYSLHPVLRHYAAQKLQADDAQYARSKDAHAHYYSGLVSSKEQDSLILKEGLSNLIAAWDWALSYGLLSAEALSQQGQAAYRLELWPQAEALLLEAERGLKEASLARARCLYALASVLKRRDPEAAERHYEEALTLARRFEAKALEADLLNTWGLLAYTRGDRARADAHLTTSLALQRDAQQPLGVARTLRTVSRLAAESGKLVEAEEMLEESRDLLEGLDDPAELAKTLNNLGGVAWMQGDLDKAQRLFERCLSIYENEGEAKHRHALALLYGNLGLVAQQLEQTKDALALHQKAYLAFADLGDLSNMALSRNNLGICHSDLSDTEAARQAFCQALRLAKRGGLITQQLESLAHLAQLTPPDEAHALWQCVATHPNTRAKTRDYARTQVDVSNEVPDLGALVARVLRADCA